MTDKGMDKKFWTNGWWLLTFDQAKEKADATNQWRISWTPDYPKNLRLYAVKKLGRWWTNQFIVNWYAWDDNN